MNFGNIIRRAVSAFGKSKTRGGTTNGTAGRPGGRPSGTSHGSTKAGLAKKAANVAKKKL